MKCEKCGGQIDPKGRYCMECFEPAPSPFADEEKKPIPKQAIYAGAGLVVLIVLVSVILSLRTMPPDRVAMEWLEACASANGLRAMKYTTDEFEASGSIDRKMSYEKIEEYATNRRETGLTFTPHPPVYDRPKRPTSAEVVVTFHYGKGLDYDRKIILRKVGRDWKVDDVR